MCGYTQPVARCGYLDAHTTLFDYGSGINIKLFGKALPWRGKEQSASGGGQAQSTTTNLRKPQLSLKRIAGTPGSELYNMSLMVRNGLVA